MNLNIWISPWTSLSSRTWFLNGSPEHVLQFKIISSLMLESAHMCEVHIYLITKVAILLAVQGFLRLLMTDCLTYHHYAAYLISLWSIDACFGIPG